MSEHRERESFSKQSVSRHCSGSHTHVFVRAVWVRGEEGAEKDETACAEDVLGVTDPVPSVFMDNRLSIQVGATSQTVKLW